MAEEEKVANVEGQELTPVEGEKTEPTTDTPEAQEPTIGELKAKNVELTANLKAMQRNLEIARQEGANVVRISQQIADIQENQALTVDLIDALRQGEGEVAGEPPTTKTPSRLEQLKANRGQQQQMEQQAASVQQQVRDMVAVAGLDVQSPEVLQALAPMGELFAKGDFAGVLAGSPKIIAELVKGKTDSLGKEMQAQIDAEVNKKLVEAGLLAVETGGPTAGASGSDALEQAMDDFNKGKITLEAFKKIKGASEK